jgi:hypothetical protein
MIVLPARVDRTTTKFSELRSSLAKFGVNAMFQDTSVDTSREIRQLESHGHMIVHSSVFWEAPSLGSGSELLATYRRYGWRPPYARSSGMTSCMWYTCLALISCRIWTHLLHWEPTGAFVLLPTGLQAPDSVQ